MATDDMSCAELVERITEYLEGAMSPAELRRVEAHLAYCDGCVSHLEQMRIAVRLVRAQPPERSSPALEERLAAAFREWAR
jgi:anti-sigma factor RsiW